VGWFLACFAGSHCLTLDGRFVELAEGMLFVELAKARDGWLWCSDRIGNKSKLGLCCLGEFVMERVKAAWSLAPTFCWTQGIWGNLLCDGWCRCHDTCNTEA
jgi:hypothetical protein